MQAGAISGVIVVIVVLALVSGAIYWFKGRNKDK